MILLLCIAGTCAAQTKQAVPLAAYRQQYLNELYSVIKGDTAYIRFFPENKQLVVEATVQLLAQQQPFRMTTSSGKSKEAVRYALLRFTIGGHSCELYVYQLLKLKEKPETAGELFLPFTDRSNGGSSYAGGRYIDLNLNDIRDGRITIDFNRAYNPYCAFTTGYNCPVPPGENALPVAIHAGERYLKNKFRH